MKRVFWFAACMAVISLCGCIFTDEMRPGFGGCPIEFTAEAESFDINGTRAAGGSDSGKWIEVGESGIGTRTSGDSTGPSGNSTRATATTWFSGARIGVWMIPSGGTIEANAQDGRANIIYRHSGEGVFKAASEALRYPGEGTVDFVACYPYRKTTASSQNLSRQTSDVDSHDSLSPQGHLYPIDISDQGNPPTIDLLYSSNARDLSSGTPLLQFRHVLTRLIFHIADSEGGSLSGLGALMDAMPARGVFDLSGRVLTADPASRATIPIPVVSAAGSQATLEAIVLPGTGLDFDIVVSLAGGTRVRLEDMRNMDFRSGYMYTYYLRLDSTAQTIEVESSDIRDWNEGNGEGEEITIGKTGGSDPGDGGDGSGDGDGDSGNGDGGNGGGNDPGDGGGGGNDPGARSEYFTEGFGNPTSGVKLAAFTGWDEHSASWSDRFAHAEIRKTAEAGGYIHFPATGPADIAISGLPAGYKTIILSYDIAAEAAGVRADCIKVYTGAHDITPEITAILSSANSFNTITVALPDGTTSLRFVSDPEVNTHGMRIDNIKLTGRR